MNLDRLKAPLPSPLPLARPCPVCAATKGHPLRQQRFMLPEGHPLRQGYGLMACLQCGFVFADTKATQAHYDLFYAKYSKYDDAATSTGGGGTPLDAARLGVTAAELARLEPRRSAAILDVGCATGGLLGALKQRGFTSLLGLDPSPTSTVYAHKNFGVEVVTGSLLDPPPLAPVDGVILSHVFEHVFDCRGAVNQLKHLLKPGGWLYVEVPDATRYHEPRFLVAPFQDLNPEHINHFSLNSLENLLGPSGFSLLESGQKDLETGPNTYYPAIWGFWCLTQAPRPAANSHFNPVAVFDEILVAAMTEYIRVSQVMLEEFDERLARDLPADQPIVVWGAGQLTLRLLVETRLGRAPIKFFVDGNPLQHGKPLGGTQVVGPDRLEDDGTPILVASTIHQDAIVRRIREDLKLGNPLILLRDPAPADSYYI